MRHTLNHRTPQPPPVLHTSQLHRMHHTCVAHITVASHASQLCRIRHTCIAHMHTSHLHSTHHTCIARITPSSHASQLHSTHHTRIAHNTPAHITPVSHTSRLQRTHRTCVTPASHLHDALITSIHHPPPSLYPSIDPASLAPHDYCFMARPASPHCAPRPILPGSPLAHRPDACRPPARGTAYNPPNGDPDALPPQPQPMPSLHPLLSEGSGMFRDPPICPPTACLPLHPTKSPHWGCITWPYDIMSS